MNNINSINLAYQSSTAVEIGVAPMLKMGSSGQLDDSSFIIKSRGDASVNSEKIITINVSALTNNQYILFGEYVGRAGYIDICKIWYT
ncbi:MAG: hypothetical protein KH230_20365 [Enterocloster asparagiformis]|nr:hypothetical protein [Enterocloster asparagiformis]